MNLLEPVALFAYRRRTVLLVAFAAIALAAGLYGRNTARALLGGGFDDPGSESTRADALLEERFGLGTPDIAVAYEHASWRVDDPRFKERLEPVIARLRAHPGVERVGDPYTDGARDVLLAEDRRAAVLMIRLGARDQAETTYDAILPLLDAPGLETSVGGKIAGSRQAQHAAERDLIRAELITLPILALMLVVFFRGVVLASLPLLIGGFAVALALASIRLLTHVTDVSIFAMNIVTFVGLGVAIDYSLFMTTRFRDELAAGIPIEHALRHTLRTAGRTVGYSGGAVAVSLLGLTVFPIMVLRSIAIAGSIVVLMALLGALLFLPAMLALLGERIRKTARKASGELRGPSRFWRRIAHFVMQKPISVTVAVTALLLVLGAPFLHIRPAVSGAAVLPADAESRKVAELLESERFARGEVSPVQVVLRADRDVLSPEGLAQVEGYVERLAKVPHVTRVDALVGGASGRTAEQLASMLASPMADTVRERMKPLVNGKDTVVRAVLDVAPASDTAAETVKTIRGLDVPSVETLVTSPAARLVDLKATLSRGLPWAFGVICLATFVVLFLAFGSVIMPLKAIVMNVLSLTASFGALVWIFQDGRFERLLDYRSPGNIELTIPVVMFAVVFGLAMDYELFLLSRVRESYDRTHDNELSVTTGLEQTAQLITRAALLLVAVMIGFVSADMLLVKELGVGMIVAVVVDATIVRALLVPATMQLMGHFNWWAPGPLARFWKNSHLGVDERSPEELEAEEAEHEGVLREQRT